MIHKYPVFCYNKLSQKPKQGAYNMENMVLRILIILSVMVTHGVASSGDFYTCNKVEELTVNDLSGISVKPLKIGSTVETLPLESFDVTRYAGKTLVFLVSATWCGYCKYDLAKTMEWRERPGWPKNDIVVVHMLVSSKKQNLQNAEAFLPSQ